MENIVDFLIGKTILSKYLIKKKLGEGSFGRIYLAESENRQYAIKVEKKRMNTNTNIKIHSLLVLEARIMQSLSGPGIPKVYGLIEGEESNMMIMDRLGKSLESLLHLLPKGKMSIKTICMLAYQMITTLEYVHSKHLIHRDIKPDNFVMGYYKKIKTLYLIDFGLAKYYRNPNNQEHNPMTIKRKLTGTARYASLNALQGVEQSRRDDLESIGYVIIYLLKGTLPWKSIMTKNKEERYLKILQKKQAVDTIELCKNEANEIETFVKYVKDLEYEEDPDYSYMKNLFLKCLSRLNFKYDYDYDWNEIDNIHSPFCNPSKKSSCKSNNEDNNKYHNSNIEDEHYSYHNRSSLMNLKNRLDKNNCIDLPNEKNRTVVNNFITVLTSQNEKNITMNSNFIQGKGQDESITINNKNTKTKSKSKNSDISKEFNQSKKKKDKKMNTYCAISDCCIIF